MNTSTLILDSYIESKKLLRIKTEMEKANDIIKIVCDFYETKDYLLKTKSRIRKIVEPRNICFFLIREYTFLSLVQVGGLFCNRDHTTVLHGIGSINDLCKYDEILKDKLETIEDNYKNYSGKTRNKYKLKDNGAVN